MERGRIERLPGFLLLVLAGWLVEGMLLPVLPLLVLDRGGDASTVGLVALAYALPSLLTRPVVGRFIDRRGVGGIQALGAVAFAVAPLGYLAPGIAMVIVARLVQGVGWALYGTANQVLIALLAPIDRRAELAGYASSCRAVAMLIGPAVGLVLYSIGASTAILAASAVGTFVAILSFGWRGIGAGVRPAAPTEREKRSGLARFVEPTSLVPMVMVSTFISSQVLFLQFAPVYVKSRGDDIDTLAIFYPTFGIVLVVAPLLLGRVSDRLGREQTIRLGCTVVLVGLVVAALPLPGLVAYVSGAVLVGSSSSMVTAAIAAGTVDRAEPGRIGSAMATFSMGFQIAAGIGALTWGTIIAWLGFPWPFFVAVGLQLMTIVIARSWLRDGRPGSAAR